MDEQCINFWRLDDQGVKQCVDKCSDQTFGANQDNQKECAEESTCYENLYIKIQFIDMYFCCIYTQTGQCEALEEQGKLTGYKYQQQNQCYTECTDDYAYPQSETNFVCDNTCQYYELTIKNYSVNKTEKHCLDPCEGDYSYQQQSSRNQCVSKCNQEYAKSQIEGDYVCSNTCIYYLTQENYNQCVDNCSQIDKYKFQDQRKCQEQCLNKFWYQNKTEKMCTADSLCNVQLDEQILNSYIYNNSQCIIEEQCKQNYYVIDNNSQCAYAQEFTSCLQYEIVEQFKNYLYDNDKNCKIQCNQEYSFEIEDTKKCVAQCDGQYQYIYQQKYCYQNCPYGYWYITTEGKVCTEQDECNVIYSGQQLYSYLYSSKQCITYDQCISSENNVFIVQEQNKCIQFEQQQCNQMKEIIEYQNYVISYSKADKNHCTDNCNDYNYIDNEQIICITNCQLINNNGLEITQKQCMLITQCQLNNYYIMKITNDSQNCYYSQLATGCNYQEDYLSSYIYQQEKQCIQECNEEYVYPKQGNICDNQCFYDYNDDQTKFYCVDACTSQLRPFKVEVERPYCTGNCSEIEGRQYQETNNSCVNYCLKRYWYISDKNIKICISNDYCNETINNEKHNSLDYEGNMCITQEECMLYSQNFLYYLDDNTGECVFYMFANQCNDIMLPTHFQAQPNYLSTSNNRCVLQCEENQHWYLKEQQKVCVNKCSDCNMSGFDISKNQCQISDVCSEHYHIQNWKEFNIRCIFGSDVNQCDDFKKYEQLKDYLYYQDIICYKNCSDNEQNPYSEEYQCVKQCTGNYATQDDNQICNNTCKYYQLLDRLFCTETCPPEYFDLNYTVKTEREYCVNQCIDVLKYEYQEDNTCVEQCTSYWYLYTEVDKVCTKTSSCQDVKDKYGQSYNLLQPTLKQCVSRCKQLFWYEDQNNENICTLSCQDQNLGSFDAETDQCNQMEICLQNYHIIINNLENEEQCIYTTYDSCDAFSRRQDTQKYSTILYGTNICTDCNMVGYEVIMKGKQIYCKEKRNMTKIIIGSSVGGALFVLIIVGIIFACYMKRKHQKDKSKLEMQSPIAQPEDEYCD